MWSEPKWSKWKHIVNSKTVGAQYIFVALLIPEQWWLSIPVYQSPRTRKGGFSHTLSANSNPLRQEETDCFEIPDITELELPKSVSGVSPQPADSENCSIYILRIAPFIWIDPVARFALCRFASQKCESGTKRAAKKAVNYRERERKTSTQRSSTQRETK